MNALHGHRHVFTMIVTTLLLGGNPAMAVAGGTMPSPEARIPAEPADSRRIEPAALEQLLSDRAFNTEASTQFVVEDRPVLTDRGFIHLGAAAWHPATTDLGNPLLYAYFWREGGYIKSSSNALCAPVLAAVHLPEGVTVDLLAVTAVDDARESLGLYLERRLALAALDGTEMAFIETDSNDSGLRIWLDDTINEPLIQNGAYQYFLSSCVTNKKKIRSVFIYYHR